MKEYYGQFSVIINAQFSNVKANSIEEAQQRVLDDSTIVFKLVDTKTGEEIELDIQEWNMIETHGIGNVSESGLTDFYIEEEK